MLPFGEDFFLILHNEKNTVLQRIHFGAVFSPHVPQAPIFSRVRMMSIINRAYAGIDVVYSMLADVFKYACI